MELLKIKKITSLEKVFPDQEPSGEGMEDVITALKKETVSFQMAYYWSGQRKGRAQVQEEQNAKLICMEMHGFDEARKELWIQFPTKEAFEEQQQTLFSTIADMDGDDGIVVYISSIKAMKRMPANWNICVNEDSVGRISQIFGEQNVKVVEKNVEFQRKRY